MTNCKTDKIELLPYKNKKIEIEFVGKAIASDGGILLLTRILSIQATSGTRFEPNTLSATEAELSKIEGNENGKVFLKKLTTGVILGLVFSLLAKDFKLIIDGCHTKLSPDKEAPREATSYGATMHKLK